MPSPQGQRLPPALPSGAYKTFQIVAPLKTHFRKATCVEADCPHYLNGFRTRVDERTERGMAQAYYIRKESGRRFTEDRDATGLTVFTFEAGQRCFGSDAHRVRVERPELFLTHPGDWRWRPTSGQQPYQHTRPEFWTEEFAENQQNLTDRIERG
jgi:hypothetical protein